MGIDKNDYLNDVLESYRMHHVQTLMDKFIKKREQLKDALEKKFKGKTATNAINSGSYAKHDAINIKFDIDLCQPFKYDSFDTLEKMADAVYTFFESEYEDNELIKYSIRKQRVSIGLTFNIDGDEIKMDVVPGRELSLGNYNESQKLNLYVRAKDLSPATCTQTSIQKHIDHITGRTSERQIIRLLKVWKNNRNYSDMKSFFIELITIRAFDDSKNIPSSLWDKLKMVIQFVADNIETIRLVDPANSNNVVSDTLTDIQKQSIKTTMSNMLQQIEMNDEFLKIYFPGNNQFFQKAKESNSLGPAVLTTKSFS